MESFGARKQSEDSELETTSCLFNGLVVARLGPTESPRSRTSSFSLALNLTLLSSVGRSGVWPLGLDIFLLVERGVCNGGHGKAKLTNVPSQAAVVYLEMSCLSSSISIRRIGRPGRNTWFVARAHVLLVTSLGSAMTVPVGK